MLNTLIITIGALGAAAQNAGTPVVRADGIGNVKIGMTLSQLAATLHERFSMPEQGDDQGCFYVYPREYPALMIENRKVVRVDVDQPGIRTAEGLGVGDSEAHVKQTYGPRLVMKPSQYSGDQGGHYLTLRSKDGQVRHTI